MSNNNEKAMDNNEKIPAQIAIRVSPDEYTAIKNKADKLGLTVSSYVKMIVFNTTITFQTEISLKADK